MDLFQFSKEKRSQLVRNTIEYSLKNFKAIPSAELEGLMEEMIYWEKLRAQSFKNKNKQEKTLSYWNDFSSRYLSTTHDLEKHGLLSEVTHKFVQDIVGNFNPTVYRFSTHVIPRFLGLLLNPTSIVQLFSKNYFIKENLTITGDTEQIRLLAQKGTLIFTPTHSSHVDSIIMGTALYYTGLPPVMYGAGINLFKNFFLGFFMNHLGAYRVDRLRVHKIYKDILKEYATCALDMGFHNLFFPGGTRSRSGTVEKKLKMGLLGTGLSVFMRKLMPIYIIPVNINTHLTLEAETLIDDFLQASGKSRYIIEDDEFSQGKKIISYFKNHIRLQSKTFVHFGKPLDPFGNDVTSTGESIDRHGRIIDIADYVKNESGIYPDKNRDQNYTQELAESIIDAFHKNNRVLSTHLVAFVLYEMLMMKHSGKDIYSLLRTRKDYYTFKVSDFFLYLDKARAQLEFLSQKDRIMYSARLKEKSDEEILNNALKYFSVYHRYSVIKREDDLLKIGDLRLLFYYHNKKSDHVYLWGRDSSLVESINRTRKNKIYTGDLILTANIRVTNSLKEMSEQCFIMFIVLPSTSFREVIYELGSFVRGNQMIVSATKGIEQQTYKFMSQILREETCVKKMGVLSGPNIANEIIQEQPSAAIIASKYEEVIESVWQLLNSSHFKVYGSNDVQGVETAGALKNIIAIACGLADGLGLENNTKSFILTRGLAEILRYGSFFGARSETFLGLAGVGDLVTTCFSHHSRNHRFGRLLAEGKSMEEAVKCIGMVVEGVNTIKAVHEVSQKFKMRMPITNGLYEILFCKLEVSQVMSDLMSARMKYEEEGILKDYQSLTHELVHKYPTPEALF
ncbi:MAG: NAD(P)H-dependent glycerol-3-phosphate dehydrogenase [Deltaproteobacteria bacterium]|nr:NAD(P)H-dependent glycerol-3-phosphate dehydrogenase [Deltaproteobacteria bacterium]